MDDDATDAFASVHYVESFIDFFQAESMDNHRIYSNFAIHMPIDDLRDVGLSACTAKGRPFPHPVGDQLERSGRDFLACLDHPDDHAFAPFPMAGLERRAHDIGIDLAISAYLAAVLPSRCNQLGVTFLPAQVCLTGFQPMRRTRPDEC